MTCGFILFDPACHIGNGWDAVVSWAFSWLSVHLIVGLFIGSILGARFGWLAPIAIILAIGVRLLPKGGNDGPDPVFTDRRDADPPVKPPRKRRVLFPNAPWNR